MTEILLNCIIAVLFIWITLNLGLDFYKRIKEEIKHKK